MGCSSALAGNLTLLFRRHRREATPFFAFSCHDLPPRFMLACRLLSRPRLGVRCTRLGSSPTCRPRLRVRSQRAGRQASHTWSRRNAAVRPLSAGRTSSRTVPRGQRSVSSNLLILKFLMRRIRDSPMRVCSGILQKGLIAVANTVRTSWIGRWSVVAGQNRWSDDRRSTHQARPVTPDHYCGLNSGGSALPSPKKKSSI